MTKTQIKLHIPDEVKNIALTLSHAGFENYLVGGCVRDLLSNKKPKDWDITTNAAPEDIVALFPHTFYENEYGTVGVVNDETEDETLKTVEVTPYRIESAYSDFRRPDEVKWGESLEDDLSRRDFTINALALDINRQPTTDNRQEKIECEIIDLFEGMNDLEKKLIRTVGKPEERFREDALRMLRALRLASELEFAIEYETQIVIEKHKGLLEHVSRERIRDEFTKIVMSEAPSMALGLAEKLGMLGFISPELEKGIGVEQNKAHLYTVWEHLLRSLDHAAKKNLPLHARLAVLFHDIAKPHTREWQNNQWTFYGHDVVGAKIARNILSDLKFSKEIIDKVCKLVRWHMFFSDTEEITHSAVRRMVRNVGPDLIWDLMNVRKSDRIGTGRPKESPYRLRKYTAMIEEVMRDPISVKQLKINGKDIMKLTKTPPGPRIGFILEILLLEVLSDPKLNTEKYLSERVLDLHKLPTKELIKLGREAKSRNEGEEEKETEKIKSKYGVK